MGRVFGLKHKKVTPETELFVGDEIFHEDKWLQIYQITQDDGIQLSNFKWVCRTELQNASDDIEILKEDLMHQLKFEHIDWDYFIETAERAKIEAEKLNENFSE